MPDDDLDDEKKLSTQLEIERNDEGNGPTGHKRTAVGTGDDAEGFKKLYSWIAKALEQTDSNHNPYNSVLSFLAEQKAVVGCLLVAHDGSVLAAKIPPLMNAETVAHAALGTFMSTEMVIKKLGQDRIHAVVSQTLDGYSIIVDIGTAILLILTTEEFDCIAGVMF
jgi:predicted regulator of Ras-like GTPase activity (Roadblock/LC7/MglB family)